MEKKKKTILRIIGIILLVLAGIYLGGLFYFKGHFMPNTIINGTDVSRMTVQEANEAVCIKEPSVSIVMKKGDEGGKITEELKLHEVSDFVFSYDVSSLLNRQNSFLWPASLFKGQELSCDEVDADYSKVKLLDSLKDLYCLKEENIIMPSDRQIIFENGELSIKDKSDGCYIDATIVKKKVLELVDAYSKDPSRNELDLTDLYEKYEGEETATDLESRLSHLRNIIDKNITIVFNDGSKEVITPEALKGLLYMEENSFHVDDEKLDSYITSLTERYGNDNTKYLSKSELKRALLNERDSTINAVQQVISTAETSGDHIDVYISSQMLYYYRDGAELFSSPVVTGYGSTITPTGTFYVAHIKRGATLKGSDYVEYVDYWIGINDAANNWNNGHLIGFHDASWRSEFGGEIYLSDPSHGCINMPTDKAAMLFENVSTGTVVHIYN